LEARLISPLSRFSRSAAARSGFGLLLFTIALLLLLAATPVRAQEAPYFVTYDHHMEEAGNLELATFSTVGIPRQGQSSYWAPFSEFEYGVTGWWTTELYLEGQGRPQNDTIFTGWRLENRFRPLKREHRINPILYFEFENINEGSRIQKEVVGHGGEFDEPNSELKHDRARELEGKLILSSNVHDWNIAENFIVEKNLSENEGLEFGYSFGVSRPLARLASGSNCRLCRENFVAGVEFYGGLGSTQQFGFGDTAHYVAPVLAWRVSDNSTVHFSPAFGLTEVSNRALLRFGYSYEIRGFGSKFASFFKGGR
jgi:hypothetical protein